MAFISVTRLRLRSWRYVVPFFLDTWASMRQIKRAPGFLGGRLIGEKGQVYWTLTAWESAEAMKAYRGSGAHRSAMPKLANWCDEAGIAHWEQPGAELPGWREAFRRLILDGRPTKLPFPAISHLTWNMAEPTVPDSIGLPLKPKQ
jgi:hypothetical protein